MKCQAGWITSWNQDFWRNINNLRYTDNTTLMEENEEELKSLLMKVKEESEKVGLNSTFKKLKSLHTVQSVQFSSVVRSCPTLCDPMNCSTPGLPVHHQLPEFTQTHIHWVGFSQTSRGLVLCWENISLVQFSRSVMNDCLRPHESQHVRPSCPSPTPRVYSNSCPSSRWCHPAISSSVIPFSSCPQSFLASFQCLFQWVNSSHQVARVLEFQLQHQSFQWTPRTDLL